MAPKINWSGKRTGWGTVIILGLKGQKWLGVQVSVPFSASGNLPSVSLARRCCLSTHPRLKLVCPSTVQQHEPNKSNKFAYFSYDLRCFLWKLFTVHIYLYMINVYMIIQICYLYNEILKNFKKHTLQFTLIAIQVKKNRANGGKCNIVYYRVVLDSTYNIYFMISV